MTRNNLFTALVLVVAAFCVFPAHADLTVKVQKGGTAPYLYAWDNDDTKLLGDFPGTQFTEKDGNYWTMPIEGVTSVNIILSMGEDGPQTEDYLNMCGVNGVISLVYDGETTMFGTMPSYTYQAGKVAYFVCPPTWDGNVKSKIKHNDYEEEHTMTRIGTDGSGLDIYADFSFTGWGDTPQYIQFYDNSNHYCEYMAYSLGGYFNTDKAVANFVDLTATDFPDENFRAAIEASTGISGVFCPNSITYLDVSNAGISDLTGINRFTNLQTLIAANNNLSQLDLTMSTLEVLDLSSNSSSLVGPSSNAGAGHITFANNTPLTYLDLSNNSGLTWFSAIYNHYGINTLQTLKLNNVPLGWASAIENQTNLVHFEMNNGNISSSESVNLSAQTKLEYLDLSDNNVAKANLTFPSSLPSLKTLKLNNCDNLSKSSTVYVSLSPFTALETLEFSDVNLYTQSIVATIPASAKATLQTIDFSNDQMSAPSLSGFTALKTFDASDNSSMTSLTLDGCTSLEEVVLTNDTGLKTLTLSNDNLSTLDCLTDVDDCTALTTIDLSGNVFTAIPDLSQTTTKYLKLNNNTISGNVTFTGNTTLKGLNLTGNSGITSLDLRNNALTALMLGGLTNCTELNVSGNVGLTSTCANNNETNFTSGLGRIYMADLSSLTTLDVSNCNIRGVATYNWMDVSSLSNLTTINASGNTAKGFTCWQGTHLPVGIKELDLSDCTNLFLSRQLDSLSITQKQTIEVFNLRNTCIASNTADFENWTSLQSLNISENPNMVNALTLNGCTSLESVDVTNDTSVPRINLTNCGLSNNNTLPLIGASTCTSLTTLDLTDNQYTSVPDISLPESCTSLYLNSNSLSSIAMPEGSPVQFLYAEDNGFSGALELTSESVPTLKGLDLGNNTGITSFSATATPLSALMLGGNTSMTTLTLHNNPKLTQTTASETMSDGSGLYVLGSTALATIDLEGTEDAPGYFTSLGANGSLANMGSVKTLKAAHNALTTFSNASELPASSYKDDNGNTQNISKVVGHPELPNLEGLTGLEYLDLSYNALCDSVHLYKNTALKHLDLSHNQVITHNANKGKKDNGSFYTTSELSNLIQTQGKREYKLYTWIAKSGSNVEPYTGDQNDTIGVFNLDLKHNTELEYLDISYTGIEHTALKHFYTYNPRYVWIQNCTALKEFYADYNGMRSFGVSNNANIERISARAMRGADMRIMQGSLNLHGEKCHNLHYADFRDSQFDSIGTCFTPALDTLLISGNPLQYLNFCRTGTSVEGYALSPNSNLVYVDASDCTIDKRQSAVYPNGTPITNVGTGANRSASGLLQVRAFNLPNLTHLDLSSDTELNLLYCNDDGMLPEITGLPSCTNLRVLHAYNDVKLGENGFTVEDNNALTTLWVSNCSLPGELKIEDCHAMDTLRCDNNALTKLDVSSLANMHWLDCFDNIGIKTLVPGASTGMTHLDLHNCSTIDLALASNTALQYFDCDNNKIRELTFAGAANIDTIHANNNNLFQINLSGTHSSLKDLQFTKNHINAIDLTGCNANVLTNIQDANNGRTIPANSVTFYVKDANNQPEMRRMYYFQLIESAEDNGGGFFLNDQYCSEDAVSNAEENIFGRGENNKKTLAGDGVNLDKITWNEQPFVGTRERRTRAEDLGLTADKVIGTIVVLSPTSVTDDVASGTETYKYNNGISESEFYLNWTASSDATVITELDDLAISSLQVVGGTGCITVTAAQTLPVTVVDLSGRVVTQRDVEAGTTVIDGLQPGIYIVAGQKVIVN